MPSRITINDANVVSSELRFTPGGKAVASIRIAVNKRTKNAQGEWEKGEATFLTCTAWEQRAQRIAEENLQPGDTVFASGLFEAKVYERKDGTKGISNEVALDAFGRDYKWDNNEKKPKQDSASFDEPAPF